MTAPIACPRCGEQERLAGNRRDDGMILVACGACGEEWERDTRPRCRECGSLNLQYSPRPLWERGRGEQRTPAGRYDAYDCIDCGGNDVTATGSPPTG